MSGNNSAIRHHGGGQSLPLQNIFLTGATGILGAHVLLDLLRSTDANIYCLVRAATPEQGRERLLSFLEFYDPKLEMYERFSRRVIPVCGALHEDKLGIAPDTYARLVEKIDATIHSAALTNLFVKMRTIEPINVKGTRHIIDFCLKTRTRYLCYVSSHTVTGDATFRAGLRFSEQDFDVDQKFDFMTYQHTKFLGEKMVREAKAEGLVWNIVRPGQIFGESKSGNYPFGDSNISGLFYDIFKTVIETKTALVSNTHFDVVPVDYVSRGLIALALFDDSRYETYHLTNPDVKTYSQVIDLLKQLGYDINFVSEKRYKEMLLKGELKVNGVEYKSATTSAFKWWFKRGISFEESAVTDCSYTCQKLSSWDIYCPPVDRRLIGTYVAAAVRDNFFAPAPRLFDRRSGSLGDSPQFEVVS